MAGEQTQTPILRDGAYKYKALLTVALGNFMGTMDMSINNISFPVLTRAFQAPLTQVMWVTLAYTLTTTSLMLVFGRLSDRMGSKRLYSTGALIFMVGMGLCALSQSLVQLIGFRILQAVGSAATGACGYAIVAEAFPPSERGKGLGLLGMSVSAGFITGPILGGLLLSVHWRAIYLVRTPFGLITFVLARIFLKADRLRAGAAPLDLLGTIFSSLGLCGVLFGVSQFKAAATSPWTCYLPLTLGAACLLVFILVELRVQDPIVDLGMFRNRVFSCAIFSLFFVFLAYPVFTLTMPFYLMQGLNVHPSTAGVFMAIVSMGTIVFGPISGSLSDRYGVVKFATLGAFIAALSFVLMRGFALTTSPAHIVLVLFMYGLGIGMFQPPNNSTIITAVTPDRLGTASAMITTQRSVALSLGTALTGLLFSLRLDTYKTVLAQTGLAASEAARRAIPPALHDVLVLFIVAQFVAAALALAARTRRGGRRIGS
jgi:EmrB/QacA subfamily drug resistance transporter